MTLLRILCVLAWGVVAVYMAPSLVSILRGKSRTGDPMRLVGFGYAIVAAGFSLRWLALPSSEEAWAMLYVLSIILALYTVYVARSYGRGPHA